MTRNLDKSENVNDFIFNKVFQPVHDHEFKSLIDHVSGNIEHIKGFEDDRILIIQGFLLVEESVSKSCSKLFKGEIRGIFNKPIHLISLLSSMKLVPSELTDSFFLLRKIRNDFSHNINMKSFESDFEGKGQITRTYNNFIKKEEKFVSIRKMIESLLVVVSMEFYGYGSNFEYLTDLLHSDEFENNISNKYIRSI